MTAHHRTYIAFQVGDTTPAGNAYLKHYNLLKTWTAKKDDHFAMLNGHERAAAVQAADKGQALRQRIKAKLQSAKNFLLLIDKAPHADSFWVSLEIGEAIDRYGLPIIAAYLNYDYILAPSFLSHLWP